MHSTTLKPAGRSMAQMARDVISLFKLRIGVLIMITALCGMAVASGPALSLAQVLVLALSVLVASASAGAFNQYVEADSDRLMVRTRAPWAAQALASARARICRSTRDCIGGSAGRWSQTT